MTSTNHNLIWKNPQYFYSLVILWLFCLLLFLFNIDAPFFYDSTMLGSRPATWFLEHPFSLLPDSLDAGHPPFFAYWIALNWKLFGRNLTVSHLAMLPALIIILAIYIKFLLVTLDQKPSFLIFLLLPAFSPFLAQIISIGPDLYLTAGLLLLVTGLTHKKTIWVSIAIFLITASSQRGLIIIPILIIYARYYHYPFRKWLAISIGLMPCAIYYGLHLHSKGWIGFNPNGPWAELYQLISWQKILIKILAFLWRLVDNGMIGLWLIIITYLIYPAQKKQQFTNGEGLFLAFGLMGVAMIGLSTSFTANPITGRYLMPYVLLLLIPTFKIFTLKDNYLKIALAGILISFSGNTWIYPDSISKSWDSSLAWLPSKNIDLQIDNYLSQNNLLKNQIASDFPLLDSEYFTRQNSDTSHFQDRTQSYAPYLLYSNLCNSYSDSELKQLATWSVVKEWHTGQVKYILYKWPVYTAQTLK